MNPKMNILTGVALIALATANAQSQQDPSVQQQPAPTLQGGSQEPVAHECLKDLSALDRQMRGDGYWTVDFVVRWDIPATHLLSPSWGPQAPYDLYSPRYQISILRAAATVLGHQGDEQTCSMVIGKLYRLYGTLVRELRQAGIDPDEVRSWRQEMIVSALPVSRLGMAPNINELAGSEIRNAKDDLLGTIVDLLPDQQSGRISLAIVTRGGFLGFGSEQVIVPWKALRAIPYVGGFMLNVDKEVMMRAPKIDGDYISEPAYLKLHSKESNEYWQKYIHD
jgi:sporulation protein YlmC with PRC-barrel domain